jgi:hypothetical protein
VSEESAEYFNKKAFNSIEGPRPLRESLTNSELNFLGVEKQKDKN